MLYTLDGAVHSHLQWLVTNWLEVSKIVKVRAGGPENGIFLVCVKMQQTPLSCSPSLVCRCQTSVWHHWGMKHSKKKKKKKKMDP